MAFLGDFGKFFGLGSTGEVVESVTGSKTLGKIAQSGSEFISGVGEKIENTISPSSTSDQPFQQSAVPVSTVGNTGPKDQANVGLTGTTMQAGFGLVPGIASGIARTVVPQISKFFGSPAGIATGVGVGGAVSMLGGENGKQKPVLTQSRRNKARVRQLVNFMGIQGAADFLSQASGRTVTSNDVVMLLLRTFRNDGAYITKAQVRNLRRTTNRFKSLEKQVKEATSMTRTTRRSPMRRTSSTTLIKN